MLFCHPANEKNESSAYAYMILFTDLLLWCHETNEGFEVQAVIHKSDCTLADVPDDDILTNAFKVGYLRGRTRETIEAACGMMPHKAPC